MLNISSQLIIEETRRRGWRYELVNDGHSSLVYIQPPNMPAKLFKSSVTVRDSALGYRLTDDKYLTYLVLRAYGLPVPETIQVTCEQDIVDFYNRNGRCVVKPTADDHGNGVAVGVDSAGAARALAVAQRDGNNDRVIAQKMLSGDDYRFLVVDGTVFVARRYAPIAIGDGTRTMTELIDELNSDERRGDGHSKPLTKISLVEALAYTGLDALYVPSAGQEIRLSGVPNLSKGGWAEDLTDVAHESLKAIARHAASSLGLCVCGIDIICNDVATPAHEQEVGIIEMNVSPGIRMHHFPAKGEPHNVAGAILDAVFGEGN